MLLLLLLLLVFCYSALPSHVHRCHNNTCRVVEYAGSKIIVLPMTMSDRDVRVTWMGVRIASRPCIVFIVIHCNLFFWMTRVIIFVEVSCLAC